MSRITLSKDGLFIAQPGFDANTASDKDMMFNMKGTVLRVYQSGLVAYPSTTQNIPGSGPFNNRYRMAEIMLGKTFPSAPVVIVGAVDSSGILYTSNIAWLFSPSGGVRPYEPLLFCISNVDRIQIWSMAASGYVPTQFFYAVMENLI